MCIIRRKITNSNVDAIVDSNLTSDFEVHADFWFKARSCLPNTRDREAQDWQREQRNHVRPAADRSREHLEACSQSLHCKLHESAFEDTGDTLTIIATVEDIRDQVDLLSIDLDRTLSKHNLTPRGAVLAANLNREIGDHGKVCDAFNTRDEVCGGEGPVEHFGGQVELQVSGVTRGGCGKQARNVYLALLACTQEV